MTSWRQRRATDSGAGGSTLSPRVAFRPAPSGHSWSAHEVWLAVAGIMVYGKQPGGLLIVPSIPQCTLHAIAATALVLVLYGLAGFAVRHRWKHWIVLHPLKVIADTSGRASLSNAQVLFFTLIVLWLSIYWVIREGSLVAVDSSVLTLLAIAVAGSGVGMITDSTRFQASAENLAWARRKNWIEKDFTKASTERVPRVGDLLTSDGNFDVARFQAVGFSLVIGIALLYNGATAAVASEFSAFVVDDTYLALIGISQGAYVGGKYVGGNLFSELNVKLDKVRSLESKFASEVAGSTAWKEKAAEDRTLTFAAETCAPGAYVDYMSAATEAAEIVRRMTGNAIDTTRIQPALPSVP